MKLRSIFAIIITIIIAIGISACSKSPESKVKDYLTKYTEWLNSDDCQKQIDLAMTNKQNLDEIFKEKQKKLLNEAGFTSEDEFQNELQKVSNDSEIMELTMKASAATLKALGPYLQNFKEEINKAMDTTAEAIEKANEELEKTLQENQAK